MSQTELDPLCGCVCEATEKSKSFWGFQMWKGSTISAVAGVGGTDLPGTSVFGNGCGSCSSEQWSLCAPEVIPESGRCHSSAHKLGASWREPPVHQWSEVKHCDQKPG